MAASQQAPTTTSVAEWFERRTYDHRRFDAASLARRKRELDATITAILPTREVAGTIGTILAQLHELNERFALVDQIVVIDASSADGSATVAERAGAETYLESEVLAWLGPALGKGDAMWRALSVARGDLVVYLDSDTLDFGPHFVTGVLGPLLATSDVRFVKATFSRPWKRSNELETDSGARVTELTAKPLFNLFFPQLAGFAQPLAGEMAAARELFASIPFLTGYAVETGLLIDISREIGIDAMAQVDLGTRTNENQSLFELSKMGYAVLRAVEARLRQDGRLRGEPIELPADLDRYLHAIHSSAGLRFEQRGVELVERPPMLELVRR